MTYSQTKVSVVIPVGKHANGLKKTIESCRFQSHSDLDILIVLAAKDHEEEVYNLSANDERIRIIQSKMVSDNQLMATGCDYAIGQYLTILPCGDSQEYNRIEKQQQHTTSLTNIHYHDAEVGQPSNLRFLTEDIFIAKPTMNILQTVLIDVEIYTRVGMFDPKQTNMFQEWFTRYFNVRGTKVPIIRSRLYRKGHNVQ